MKKIILLFLIFTTPFVKSQNCTELINIEKNKLSLFDKLKIPAHTERRIEIDFNYDKLEKKLLLKVQPYNLRMIDNFSYMKIVFVSKESITFKNQYKKKYEAIESNFETYLSNSDITKILKEDVSYIELQNPNSKYGGEIASDFKLSTESSSLFKKRLQCILKLKNYDTTANIKQVSNTKSLPSNFSEFLYINPSEDLTSLTVTSKDIFIPNKSSEKNIKLSFLYSKKENTYNLIIDQNIRSYMRLKRAYLNYEDGSKDIVMGEKVNYGGNHSVYGSTIHRELNTNQIKNILNKNIISIKLEGEYMDDDSDWSANINLSKDKNEDIKDSFSCYQYANEKPNDFHQIIFKNYTNYIKTKQYKLATKELLKIVKYNSGNYNYELSKIYFRIGYLYQTSGENLYARKYYRKSIKLGNSDKEVYFNMALAHISDDLELVERINSLGNTDEDNRLYDKLIVTRNKKLKIAANYLEKYITLEKENKIALDHLLQVYSALNDSKNISRVKGMLNK